MVYVLGIYEKILCKIRKVKIRQLGFPADQKTKDPHKEDSWKSAKFFFLSYLAFSKKLEPIPKICSCDLIIKANFYANFWHKF